MSDSPKRPLNQSQWGIVWREFRKRKLALACAGVVVCLISVSIFAPFLANDRPLFYRGVNRFEFRNSVRTYRELLQRFSTSTVAAEDQERAARMKSLKLQAGLITKALPDEAATRFREQHARALAAIQEESDAGAAELRTLRNELQGEIGGRDVELASRTWFPVWASLGWLEVGFMTWNLLLLTCPGWLYLMYRYVPPEKATLRLRLMLGTWVLVPLLASGLWWWQVPARIDRSNYKAGVLASDEAAETALVVYETVMWTPIPFGIDENDIANKLAKPAWLAWRAEKKDEDTARKPSSIWNGPHWLGTDGLGRDVMARMIWGGRVSLSVGVVAVSIYISIGIVIGAIAGYFRGITDLVISRIIEVVICFPAFFLILTIVALVGPSIFNIMVIIGLTGWTGVARLIRGEFLRLVDQEFVLAGRALGYSPVRIIFKHILPNAVAPVVVSATFGVAGAILTESSLSFLGLGISVPTPSWGSMLHDGRPAMMHAPWLIWYPGLIIFLTISCYNLVGEALRDASDPRLRGSR